MSFAARFAWLGLSGVVVGALTGCGLFGGSPSQCETIAATMSESIADVTEDLGSLEVNLERLRRDADQLPGAEAKQTVIDFVAAAENYLTFSIFMEIDLDRGDPTIQDLDEALGTDADVADAEFLSKEAAWERFEELFGDKPDLIEQSDPSSLPASFRVTLTDIGTADAFVERYQGQTGVDQLLDPRQTIAEAGGDAIEATDVKELRDRFTSTCEA